MPAVDVDDEPFIDPDELKVPESPEHRRVAELIAVAAELQMTDTAVYRDMNWYPLDGGNAIAPDVMTLPDGTLPVGAKSYRQPDGGPLPGVVIEVPSNSDAVNSFLAKTSRCQRLGVVVYMVTVEDGFVGVVRMAGVGTDYLHWTGRPIPELGNICVDVSDGEIVIRSATNQVFRRAVDMIADANQRATDADQRATEATNRAEALEAQLRALGAEPEPNE
jgi:Putative restriction endonuclease